MSQLLLLVSCGIPQWPALARGWGGCGEGKGGEGKGWEGKVVVCCCHFCKVDVDLTKISAMCCVCNCTLLQQEKN